MINIYAGLDLVEKLVKDAKRYRSFDQQDKLLTCINEINKTLAEISKRIDHETTVNTNS